MQGACAIFLGVACLHYLTKSANFGKIVIEHEMCVLIFFATCVCIMFIAKFKKIGPMGAEWFNADRRTDIREVIVAFIDFTNTPKESSVFHITLTHWFL
jgi:hypothetical protein